MINCSMTTRSREKDDEEFESAVRELTEHFNVQIEQNNTAAVNLYKANVKQLHRKDYLENLRRMNIEKSKKLANKQIKAADMYNGMQNWSKKITGNSGNGEASSRTRVEVLTHEPISQQDINKRFAFTKRVARDLYENIDGGATTSKYALKNRLKIDRHGYLNCAGLDNSILAAGSYKSCFILDLEHDFIQKIKNPTTSIAFLDSAQHHLTTAPVILGGLDGKVKLWYRELSKLETLYTHGLACVSGMKLFPSNEHLVSCSPEGSWIMCDIQSKKTVIEKVGEDVLNSIDVHPDGRTLSTVSLGGSVKLWDIRSSNCINHLESGDGTFSAQFLTFGTRVVIAKSGSVLVRNLQFFHKSEASWLTGDSLKCMALDSSRTHVACGGNSLYTLDSSTTLGNFLNFNMACNRDEGSLEALAFSNDAEVLCGLTLDSAMIFLPQ